MDIFKVMNKLLVISITFVLVSCDLLGRIQRRSVTIGNYEKKALQLSKENRALKAKVSSLNAEIQSLKTNNNYLKMQLQKNKPASRSVASIAVPVATLKNDMVKQKVYKWTPTQLLNIGQREFDNKKYTKSAQFLHTYISMEDIHKTVDDQILFQAGLAAYESGSYFSWADKYFKRLINNYPTSQYFRGAKLWLALSQYHQGDKKSFYATLEEFRKKYKNTREWEILRGHYDDLVYKKNK